MCGKENALLSTAAGIMYKVEVEEVDHFKNIRAEVRRIELETPIDS